MKKIILLTLCTVLAAFTAVSAQESTVLPEPTATPEPVISIDVPADPADDGTIIERPTETPEEEIIIERPTATPEEEIVLEIPTATAVPVVIVVNPNMGNVSGDGVLDGKGNNTVKLWDRSLYENQPKSVTLSNAKEMFQTGMEVPKPLLDRPINDAWDDLKPGYACEAILNAPYYFQKLNFGQEFTLDVTFRNVGTETWDFNIDVMQYTGDKLEKNGKYIYDLGKDFKDSGNMNDRIVKPAQSIRITIPMRAPTEKYHDDNKYYGAYTLVRNWGNYGWTEYLKDGGVIEHSSYDTLHDGRWDRIKDEQKFSNALFCPVYFYIYVP